MAIPVGQPAPELEFVFTLYSDELKPVRLADFRGKKNVLLLFFPAAFTGVCSTELDQVNNELDIYENLDTQVLAISTDAPFTLAEFKKAHGFRFPLLSDHDAEVSKLYGTKYNRDFTHMKLDRISKRAAFVIDKEGIVRYAEILDDPTQLPNFDAIKQTLTEIAQPA